MAMILGALVGKCVERIAASVEESATLVLGIKDDLEDLERKLQMIRSVLRDAERRRIQDKAVDLWLNQLEDVMYDAQDILEHCKFKRPRLLQDQPTSSSASPVRSDSLLPSCVSDVSFRHKIGKKIKKLNDRLERIGKDKDMFMFTVELSKPDDIRRPSGVNLRQTSPLEEDDVVGSGIQEATDHLVELILGKPNQNQNQNCRVFAILGMGGIGKTTLAQKLYNEPRIQSSFQKRVWVCISQSFSDIDLLKQIIRSAGGHHGDAQTKAELEPLLINVIRGERLFLVLDDVWRADVWVDLLRKPLRQGKTASCTLVVTTRKEDVARSMGTEHVHRVEKLSVESGWDMLRKRAFMNGEEEEIKSLKDIGIQIVKKCDGLPLAINTIAGVLSVKDRTSTEWERVLRSSRWSMSQLPDGVGGALYLSYDDLPSDLKQCFLYLSLFPEDYLYTMSEIVPLWIAEGLVETHGSNSLEDTAEEYYTELTRRSLLHPVPKYVWNEILDYWDQSESKMHDLLRLLACHLSGNNFFCGNVESISTSDASQPRRLFIEHTRGSAVLTTDSIIPQKRIRTLMLLNRYSTVVIENHLISRLRRLRVLRINREGIDCLPDSIGDLIYLRYLNLDYTAVSELPGSLGRLTNLQFLSLSHCKSLHSGADPIRGLMNLRYLNLDETGVSNLSESLGRLTNLQSLSLSNCKTLFCVPDSIGGLIHLRHLNLNHTDVFELPESLGSLTNLQFLSLFNCNSLHSVPNSIGDLIRLRHLNLNGTAISELPQSLGGLTNLQFLSFAYCNFLQSVPDSIGGLIQLRSLACSKASQLPESLGPLKNLQLLNLSNCRLQSVPDSIGGLRQLRSLVLDGNELSELPESLGRLTNLQSLSLFCCWSFHSVPDAIGSLIHLRDLELSYSAVSELPDSLGRLTNLQNLHLSNCKSLHTFPQVITRLCNLRFLNMVGTVRHVPKGIGKLQQLHHLSGVVLGDDDSIAVAGKPQQGQGCHLEDLLDLSQLRYLGIERLERASTGMLVALRSMSYLTRLVLRCSQQTDGDGQQSNTEEETAKIIKIEEMFNELVLPKRLISLTLNSCFSRSYPTWMATSSLPKLYDITLENFKSCPQVPPLGELHQLRRAWIKGATAVVTIGPEFMGAGVRQGIHELTSIAFPKLERLFFIDMANWEEWSFGRETEERAAGQEGRIENRSLMSFPCLQKLIISNCPKLPTLPISGLPALKSLEVRSCPALKDVGSLPALKSLEASGCPALKDVGSQNALKKLILSDYKMECLPEWLIQLLQQRSQDEDSSFRFKLSCKVELLCKCLKDGPYWPTIQQIPWVEAKDDRKDQRAFLNYTKDPYSYKTNLSGSHDPTV